MKKTLKKNIDFLPYLLTAPAIIIMTILVFYPVAATFLYSLRKMKLTNPSDNSFVGINNYISILQSQSFLYSLQNTLIITVIVVFLCLLFGIMISLILNVDSKVKNILTAIAVLPWALPPVVNGILWRWIFYPGYGFMNKILININIIDEPIQWLSNRYSLMVIIAIVVAWRNIPFCSIVLLSSMKAIPETIYEAATIDGASKMQIFLKITIPLLIPAFGIILTFTSISAINVFDEIISLSGYSNLGKTLLLEDYITTFSFLDFGKGSAMSYIIMLIAGIFGLLYINNMSKRTDYL